MTRDQPLSYVLPLKWDEATDRAARAELTAYLEFLAALVEVIVVDGSPPELFAAHHQEWSGIAHHVRPAGVCRNGKVAGVHTGVQLARTEHVVVADDDVRYDAVNLAAVSRLLGDYDLVGPQNVFRPLPWHAAWDASRSLLNRALAADYPGTFGLRRSTFLGMGGYDGDVLFENLELMRTVRAYGGRVVRPLDVYVDRRPPSAAHFRGQRVRQAYDDLAQPWRLATFLSVLPAAVVAARRHGPVPLAAGVGAVVAMAECGRRRAGGREHFPGQVPWFAPAWVAERAVCSWLALGQLVLHGGVGYASSRLRVAAHGTGWIRRRLEASPHPLVAPTGAEGHRPVRAVAERLEGRPAAAAERDGLPAGVDLAAG